MRNTILQGDALALLATLPDNYVQCCITSPPYYGLRDYGIDGQIGLEDTPETYIARLVEVFREVRRVLRHDGTLWVNIGDSYAGSGKGWGNTQHGKLGKHAIEFLPGPTPEIEGLKPKDLIGIPWLLAFALRADGWYLRSDIIWHKPNCMPESVEDRPTTAHEHIFLLAKSERYYYDADAIREPLQESSIGREERKQRLIDTTGVGTIGKQIENGVDISHGYAGLALARNGKTGYNPAGRNKRSVWTIPTMPYSAAHFATFPPKLIEPCILAGTSPRACEHCGAVWERVTSQTTSFEGGSGKAGRTAEEVNSRGKWAGKQYGTNLKLGPVVSVNTLGWHPTCTCANNTGSSKCIVLDPFMGAGTVALVAIRHGRNWLGVELNPTYITLAEKRIAYVQQNLWSIEEIAV